MNDLSDLVSRLRAMARFEHDDLSIGNEAAAEISRLEARCARLEALLKDNEYIQSKADYNKGHLSHYNWLREKESSALAEPGETK